MARFKRLEIYRIFTETGIVPLYYNASAGIVKKAVLACYKGGARVFEFTNRGDFAHEVFSEVNKWAAKECPDMVLGVGSVVDAPATSLYIQLGAGFIVSPLLNPEMARICNRRKIPWIPGCGTISEIGQAEELGAEIVKIFPAGQLGGPAFLKAVLGPCPWSSIMPSGGAGPEYESIKSWVDAGAACIGLGSALFPKKAIETDDYEVITKMAELAVRTFKELKK
jgi:2-dehydro-3-deoxyphosphogluconate aldolase/(4S)-4-hydroxy-2-oxoglutarate aldolase